MTRILATAHDFLHDLSTYEGTRVSPAPAGQEGRPAIVVRDILDRLPRPFQGRRAGDSHAIKFAPYRL